MNPLSTLAVVASTLLLVIKISIFTTVVAWENYKAKRREHLLSSLRSSLEQKMEEGGLLGSYDEHVQLSHQLDQMLLGKM